MKVRGGTIKTGEVPLGNAIDTKGELVTAEAKRLMRGAPNAEPIAVAGGLPERQGHHAVRHAERRRRPQERNDVRDRSGLLRRPSSAEQSPLPDRRGRRRDDRRHVRERPAPERRRALSRSARSSTSASSGRPRGPSRTSRSTFSRTTARSPSTRTSPSSSIDASPDGIEVDKAGNVFVANKAGVTVFKADGKKIGNIAVPEQPTGLAFGGTDLKTLYITTQGSKIYR